MNGKRFNHMNVKTKPTCLQVRGNADERLSELRNLRGRRRRRQYLLRESELFKSGLFKGSSKTMVFTEPRQTERALRESENKFRDLAEKSLVGIYLIQDDVFKYINPKFAEIFGYTIDILTKTKRKVPKDLVSPEDWSLVQENIRKRIAGETESIHFEFRGVTRKKEVIHVEVYGSRTIYKGRPALIGTLLDITARKRAEELLKQAEGKYRSIFENAVEGIFQSTPAGKLIAANPAFAKMLGYGSPDELLLSVTNISNQIYVLPAVRTQFMQGIERDGLVRGFECELYRKDGSKIWVSMSARDVRDGDNIIMYYEGTVEDITEKKKVEQELGRLNQFNTAIIENAPVAIFIIDMNGKFMSVNPALASLSGLGQETEDKLVGFNWLQNPYTVRCGLAEYIRKGLEGEPFQLWDFAFLNYRGDKNIFMDFKGVPLKSKDGAIEGLLCIIEETTERVKTRAKLMQEVKMSTIGRLSAGIAHELNNPLGTLVAYAERASNYLESIGEDHLRQFDLEKLKGYLKIIDEEAFRCKRVVSDVLSVPRQEGLEITQVDIEKLLDIILERVSVDHMGLGITREADAPLPRILADRGVLRQVFVNLIINAVDALEGRMDAKLWVRTSLKNDMVIVEVEDNGIGIPDTIIDKIFEPFFTTKESKKGIGLGLSLCHDFVKSMGGTIKVESKPGSGTIFVVSLPINRRRKKEEERLS
jgi:PAS domain S-box-containing protein